MFNNDLFLLLTCKWSHSNTYWPTFTQNFVHFFIPPKKESETSQTIRIIPIEINTDTKLHDELVKKQTKFPEIEDDDDNNKDSQIFSNEEEEKTIQLVTEKEKAKTIVRKVRQPSANSTKDKLDDFTEKRMEDFLAMHQKKSGDKKEKVDDLDKNDCVDDESEDYSGRFPYFLYYFLY